MRLLVALFASAFLLLVSAMTVRAEQVDPVGAIYAAAQNWRVDPAPMLAVSNCESVGFDTFAVGDHGTSFGLFQLHRHGLLEVFYGQGYDDPFDPEQSADFVARWLATGGSWRPWTCARRMGL